ncbi:MAG: HAD hydrolase family protein [Candidatus Helarchaeota archaeon]
MFQVCAWDLEGPLSMTDFAAEIFKYLEHKIPNTHNLGELFYLISKYDDYLIDYPENQKRLNIQRYDPGDTLRLLAPFYVNYFTNEELIKIAKNKLGIIPGAVKTISYLKKEWDVYIISTSYTQFAYQVASQLGISEDHVYCTVLDIDNFQDISENLDNKIHELIHNIFPKYISNDKNLDSVIEDLNTFFWDDRSSSYYKIMEKVIVRGGKQKEYAVEDIANKTGSSVKEIIVTGDSITDIYMLKRISSENGIAISFNGNNYSFSSANIAVTTPNVMGILPIFLNYENIWEFINKWENDFDKFKLIPKKIPDDLIPSSLKKYYINNGFVPQINDIRNITDEKENKLINLQKEMRKKVRGWVGELG